MTEFIIKQLPYDLGNHAGLALIGKYLKRLNFNALVDPAFPVRSGIPESVPPHPQKHRLPIEINTLALILVSPNR